MSDFSATDVAFSGIRFVRERPRTVAIWAGAQLVLSLVLGAIAVVTMGPYIGQLQGLSRQRPADPAQVMAVISHVGPMYAILLPLSLLINAVVYATVARAVLRPADEGMGYIRFGADELRQFLLILLVFVLGLLTEFAVTFVVAIPGVILGLMFRSATPLVIVLCALLFLAIMIYLIVRFSLASAMTFHTRRVDLFGSWGLTRGQFWKMFATYFLVVALALVIVILVSIISAAVAAVLGGIGGMAAVFSGAVGSINDYFAPARLAVTVIWALVTPLFWALFLMPPAEIYRQLSGAADPALDPSTFD
jgi:hypothetical protein